MCVKADARINVVTYPAVIDESPDEGDPANSIAIEVTFRMIHLANLRNSGDPAANWYKVIDDDLKERIEELLKPNTPATDQVSKTVDMIGDD